MSKPRKATAADIYGMGHHGGPSREPELDPTPMEIPLGAKQPMSLNEMIARFITEKVEEVSQGEYDSPEDDMDYEEDDDDLLLDMSPYTLQELTEEEPPPPVEQEAQPPEDPPRTEEDQAPQE